MSEKTTREKMLGATPEGRQILEDEAEQRRQGGTAGFADTPRDESGRFATPAEDPSKKTAQEQLSDIADALQKQNPRMSRAEAMARACKEHPALVAAAQGKHDVGTRTDPTR